MSSLDSVHQLGSDFDKLISEQTKAIEEYDAEIKHWEKLLNDYECLDKRLQTLPDALSYNTMVSVNKFAMFPAKVVNTNKILVFLGDGYFVERSAKQAREIVSRRMTHVRESLEKVRKEKKLFVDEKEWSEKLLKERQDKVDIMEPYVETEEKPRKKVHSKQENLKEHRMELQERAKKVKEKLEMDKNWNSLDDARDIKRYLHLKSKDSPRDSASHTNHRENERAYDEKLQPRSDTTNMTDLKDHGNSLTTEDATAEAAKDSSSVSTKKKTTKHVKFSDDIKQHDDITTQKERIVYFNHSDVKPDPKDDSCEHIFYSPSQITKDAIRKTHKLQNEDGNNTETNSASPRIKAFTGKVVERAEDNEQSSYPAQHKNPVVSRFKLQRKKI